MMTGDFYKPLDGVRILSFEIAFALPAGTRVLSDLGAEVVRVSPPSGNNFGRYVSLTDGVFHGKPCISIDLTTDKGRALAMDMAMEADVVCNNFRPSILEKYGLGAGTLRAKKSSLIVLQLSGYGTPGPWSNYPAYGPSTEAAGGMNRLLVNEDEVPIRIGSGVFSDQLAGRHAALALLAALERKGRTGQGTTIDLSMTECITHLMGTLVTRAAMSGCVPENQGNRDGTCVPQGVYPCTGDDEWIAISVGDDLWSGFVDVLDDQRLRDARYHDKVARADAHDFIDQVIETFTVDQDKDILAARLQAAGIAAAPVRTVADAALDPQLRARSSLQMVRHHRSLLGYSAHPHPPLPWRIVGRARKPLTDYRNNGQDNASCLSNWLGMAPAEVQALEASGVLYNEGPLEMGTREAPKRNYDPAFAEKLDLPR